MADAFGARGAICGLGFGAAGCFGAGHALGTLVSTVRVVVFVGAVMGSWQRWSTVSKKG